MKIFVLIGILFLAGCVAPGTPAPLPNVASTQSLCAWYGGLNGVGMKLKNYNGYITKQEKEEARAELLSRKDQFTDQEWAEIESPYPRPFVGMSETAMICAFGTTAANSSNGSWGVSKQYVYENRHVDYIYTRNGKVTSWQT